jgi:hypothetical protein
MVLASLWTAQVELIDSLDSVRRLGIQLGRKVPEKLLDGPWWHARQSNGSMIRLQ